MDWEALPAREMLDALDRLEGARRRTIANAYDVVVAVQRRDDTELGGTDDYHHPERLLPA